MWKSNERALPVLIARNEAERWRVIREQGFAVLALQ
jgi:hypothetical protein